MTEPVTTLRVTVTQNDGAINYTYELTTPGGARDDGPLKQEYGVKINPALVRDLCRDIDEILNRGLNGEPGYRTELIESSKALYGHLFRPIYGDTEPELAAKVRGVEGPLLVWTSENLVPWDLLHDGKQFLGLAHDLGQGSVVRDAFVAGRGVGRVGKALIVGDPTNDLAEARREAEYVARWLEARGAHCTLLLGEQATLAGVVKTLSSVKYDLLHYCGHVHIQQSADDSGLMLHRRQVLDKAALESVAGTGAPPVVFINGCRSAEPVANLCLTFMKMGAKMVVGNRAMVPEPSARRFAEEFYQRLLKDERAGAAMRAARQSLLDEGDAGWASFQLHGDPSLHVTGRPTTSASSPPQDDTEPFTPEASALMRRVRAGAREQGVVTSRELLFGLVTAPEMQPTLRGSIGARGLEHLIEVLHLILGMSPGWDQGDDATDTEEVPLSDSVAGVLVQAKNTASAEGRAAVTTADIATAFAETGGGSSGRLLKLVGVSLRQLLAPGSKAAASEERLGKDKRVGGRTSSASTSGKAFGYGARLRADLLDDDAAEAVRAARFLADAKQSLVGTNTFLEGFGLAGSPVLRRALEAQGQAGKQALRVLFSRPLSERAFSRRSRAALEQAVEDAEPENPVGEAAILLALLDDHDAAAHLLLKKLGVDPDRLIEELRSSG